MKEGRKEARKELCVFCLCVCLLPFRFSFCVRFLFFLFSFAPCWLSTQPLPPPSQQKQQSSSASKTRKQEEWNNPDAPTPHTGHKRSITRHNKVRSWNPGRAHSTHTHTHTHPFAHSTLTLLTRFPSLIVSNEQQKGQQ